MKKELIKCSICEASTEHYLTKIFLRKHKVKYFRCTNCYFIQAERPTYWLREAYSSAIIDSDTGLISRNIALSKITAIFCLLSSGKKTRVLDYGGGYGILTRMLRDIGIDCYWNDKYANNLFAKGFEDKNGRKYDAITAFELFEHLENPLDEINNILKKYKPKMLLFSTLLHNGNPPKDWWYFVPEGGQHITLYTKKSLEILARKMRMKFSTNGCNIHIFSKKKIPSVAMKLISILGPSASVIFSLFFRSKAFDDRTKIVASK
jgi:SAM-dependent methyltransferase